MAVHIETGTMVAPGYKSRTLAHLGLVAGMYEELCGLFMIGIH